MPIIFNILAEKINAPDSKGKITLADGLSELASREQYLALEMHDQRYDIGVKYGLLSAQIALALNGQDRDQVLTRLLELLAVRELGRKRA